MKKDIRDYLHLYLGCKMERGAIVTGALLDACKEAAFNAWEDMKPLLRPLSSMTEEEAIEVCKLQTDQKKWNNIEVLFIKQDKIDYIDGSRWQGDGVDEMMDLVVRFDMLNPEQFKFLLSKSFDLFHLREDGLALDITKQPAQ